jgi:xanthine dehydrogenase small subunit
VRSAKDGCAPQGQCGCCTVWVDASPRVACVTPVRRVAGRQVTTLDGVPEPVRQRWADAFVATGASQCGFCTPGILMRLMALEQKAPGGLSSEQVDQALLAHLCRCTGWRTITEAAGLARPAPTAAATGPGRDWAAASRRAGLEGRSPQRVGPDVVLGQGGFADDSAPRDALVAVPAGREWVVAETLVEARALAAKVQGRRSPRALSWPLDIPEGDWDLRLATTWVEPAYLETDASWCRPGGQPAPPLANGGAFGGKAASSVGAVARQLADQHGRPVRVLLSREDVVRRGPKRPPLALGLRADGSGRLRIATTPGVAEAIAAVAPAVEVESVPLAGPPTSGAVRGAGWMELAAALGVLRARREKRTTVVVSSPEGSVAEAEVLPSGAVAVQVSCGQVLDETVLRSYCIGAAHMGLGWVRSEGLAVDDHGEAHDLTIRSFGILRARDMPRVEVGLVPGPDAPVNGSDAVMAAVAGAAWLRAGLPERWPFERAGAGSD